MIFFDSYLLLMAPGLNVRHLHAVHAGNGVVKPRLPCQKPAFAQAAGFHRFTNSQHCCLLLSCNLCSDFTIPTSKLQIITITFFTPSETHSDMCLSFFCSFSDKYSDMFFIPSLLLNAGFFSIFSIVRINRILCVASI